MIVRIHVKIFSCNVPTNPEDQITPKTPKDKQLKKQYNTIQVQVESKATGLSVGS